MLKVADLRLTGHEFQAFGDALVRLLVKMAAVPEPEALGIGPVRDKPDFLGPVERAEDFQAYEAGLPIYQVRPLAKSFLDLGDLGIGDDEFAERNKRAGDVPGSGFPHDRAEGRSPAS